MKALGNYPRPPALPPSVAKSLDVEFIGVSESLQKGQPVAVEIKLGNVPSGTVASVQWKQDESPISDGYYGNIDLYDGIKLSYHGLLPYYSETGSTNIGVEISIDGIIREEIITIPYKSGAFYNTEVERVLQSVQPMRIPAKITTDCTTYGNKSLGRKIGSAWAGTSVYYFDHNEEYSAYVQLPDSTFVWVPYDCVRISSGNYTVSEDFNQYDKETFVNTKGYESSTPYLVWINPQRQKVNIFMGSKYGWQLLKSFSCATGANETPTPLGTYKYTAWDTAWIKPDYQVKSVLYFDIYRGLAFHSRLYSPDGAYIIDATIGRPASHGCIRMYDDDLAWMKLYIPFQTTVIVY